MGTVDSRPQNIVLALIVKFGCLALSAVGIANMWFAIFADVGVMIIAVLNAIERERKLWQSVKESVLYAICVV